MTIIESQFVTFLLSMISFWSLGNTDDIICFRAIVGVSNNKYGLFELNVDNWKDGGGSDYAVSDVRR